MKVLIACEESQEVCKAFRAKGHEAYSCDIQECSGGHPEWHVMGDVLPILGGRCQITTMDGSTHDIGGRWDLIIAHPPCTYLTAASAVRLFDKNHQIKDHDRYQKGIDAASSFSFTALQPSYPTLRAWRSLAKRTCLWLRGLPMLYPTNMVEPTGYWIGAHGHNKAKNGMSKGFRNQKMRSKTFAGIARAMADQWGAK